jgi:hypothetical protein
MDWNLEIAIRKAELGAVGHNQEQIVNVSEEQIKEIRGYFDIHEILTYLAKSRDVLLHGSRKKYSMVITDKEITATQNGQTAIVEAIIDKNHVKRKNNISEGYLLFHSSQGNVLGVYGMDELTFKKKGLIYVIDKKYKDLFSPDGRNYVATNSSVPFIATIPVKLKDITAEVYDSDKDRSLSFRGKE